MGKKVGTCVDPSALSPGNRNPSDPVKTPVRADVFPAAARPANKITALHTLKPLTSPKAQMPIGSSAC